MKAINEGKLKHADLKINETGQVCKDGKCFSFYNPCFNIINK